MARLDLSHLQVQRQAGLGWGLAQLLLQGLVQEREAPQLQIQAQAVSLEFIFLHQPHPQLRVQLLPQLALLALPQFVDRGWGNKQLLAGRPTLLLLDLETRVKVLPCDETAILPPINPITPSQVAETGCVMKSRTVCKLL